MDGVFTLPYSEYRVAETLNKIFRKKEGYGLFVPMSRQLKGIDLLLFNQKSGKKLTLQIKASRAYFRDTQKDDTKYGIWFNNFIDKYKKGNADYYIIYGLYPSYNVKDISSKNCWKDLILCYNEKEMIAFLEKVRLKRDNRKKDKFFGYVFNDDRQIWAERGFPKNVDMTKHLLKNKISEMEARLK